MSDVGGWTRFVHERTGITPTRSRSASNLCSNIIKKTTFSEKRVLCCVCGLADAAGYDRPPTSPNSGGLASYRVAIARFAQAETWATRPQPPRHSNSNIARKLVEDRSGPRSDDRLSPLGFPNLRAKESNFAQHVGNWRASLAFVPFTVVC